MKKKILIAVAAVVVLIAAIVLIVFAAGGEKVPAPTLSLEGSYMLAASVDAGDATVDGSQFVVFEGDQIALYRDGQQAFSGNFEIDGDHIKIPDMDRSYAVEKHNDNYVNFFTTDTTFLSLIRVSGTDAALGLADPAQIEGSWHVDYRSTDRTDDEVIRFAAGTIELYRNGAEAPAATGSYQIDEAGLLHADLSPASFQLLLQGEILYLIECETGYVWVLSAVA